MEVLEENFTQKNSSKFCCKKCAFVTGNKNDYSRHLLTLKHYRKKNHEFLEVLEENFTQHDKYVCKCGKTYKTHSGYWKHTKKCPDFGKDLVKELDKDLAKELDTGNAQADCQIVSTTKTVDNQLSYAIMELLKQNNDLRNIIIEQNRQHIEQSKTSTDMVLELNKQTIEMTAQSLSSITTEILAAIKTNSSQTMINCNNTLNSNNTFNLQIFLNETCKDALNINEFIENIKVTNADLEETARLGYSGGISRIFINELNSMDITKKPIHCSDAKRETIYIKENNVWEKDDDNKTRLIKAVKQAARKNYMHIFEWEKDFPQYKKDPDSKLGKLYNKIVSNSMSGSSDSEQIDNVNKIVKIIIRNSIIDKQMVISM